MKKNSNKEANKVFLPWVFSFCFVVKMTTTIAAAAAATTKRWAYGVCTAAWVQSTTHTTAHTHVHIYSEIKLLLSQADIKLYTVFIALNFLLLLRTISQYSLPNCLVSRAWLWIQYLSVYLTSLDYCVYLFAHSLLFFASLCCIAVKNCFLISIQLALIQS